MICPTDDGPEEHALRHVDHAQLRNAMTHLTTTEQTLLELQHPCAASRSPRSPHASTSPAAASVSDNIAPCTDYVTCSQQPNTAPCRSPRTHPHQSAHISGISAGTASSWTRHGFALAAETHGSMGGTAAHPAAWKAAAAIKPNQST